MKKFNLKQLLFIASGGTTLFACHALYSGNPKFYSQVVMPSVHKLTTAENAHNFAIFCAKSGLYPSASDVEFDNLKTHALKKSLKNPIGLAAGFDKHCEAMEGLLNFGFGFIEVGGVTPEAQPGNEKPRVFRLEEDLAIINRYGFNSCGHIPAVKRFQTWFDRQTVDQQQGERGIVGVNLGKNKTTEDVASDYVKGVQAFGPMADFLVINVSSPNTPGLRKLQGSEQLKTIVSAVVKERNELVRKDKPPILVKIAPDLTEKDKIDIAYVVAAKDSGVDGLIVSNTTVTRPSDLKSSNKREIGGLSGAPLRSLSTDTIRDMYRLTSGRLTIIGVGGVFSGKDALEKIKAGASLVQIYSSLAYLGPPVVTTIKQELSELLQQEGYDNVSQAVGVDVHANTASKDVAD